MTKIAYLDCFSGVSGNMLLGAIISVGLDEKILRDTLSGLNLPAWQLTVDRIRECGFAAIRVEVKGGTKQPHRRLRDIRQILTESRLPEPVREGSLAVFIRLAKAEAAVHGVNQDEIHFHEVGAVDAIIDVVGAVAGFFHLEIERIVCSSLPLSQGWASCDHGEIPLPAPAVSLLLKDIPVYGIELSQELVTPTGAAIIAEMATGFGVMPPMTMVAVGYGAGTLKRDDGRPNLLRFCIGKSCRVDEAQEVEVIETHLDDWNSEIWPHVSERLLKSGALDVSLVPIQMKKGRPGFLLRVICSIEHSHLLKKIIFRETTAIGLRFHRQHRLTLPRKAVMVNTPWGTVAAKAVETAEGKIITPEYEACRKMANEKNISIQSIYRAVIR
jgi:hypothetical protein